jgi:hypothetical protein
LTCRNGHPWGADEVTISWASCDCPAAPADHGRGHLVVHCGGLGCLETWHTDPDTLMEVITDRRLGTTADRDRSRAMAALDAAWTLLRQASEHHVTLLSPAHPTRVWIEGLKSWIKDCTAAINEAQRLAKPITRSDEVAHVEEMATGMAAVVDSFQIYASMLERFRSADEAASGQSQPGSLAAVADDERVLLSCRVALKRSMQQLVGALQEDR